MPESTCLHIQDRESGPIRVVELSWISVRIGRAAYCEVCLPEGRLPDEACRLTRRGRTWSLVPAQRGKKVLLDGRPLDGPCPLPFDVPFRIGRYCLTLRRDVAAEPDWELYPASGSGGRTRSAEAGPLDAPQPAAAAAAEAESPAAQPTVEGRTGGDSERWRARWKAAEAHFRARADRLRSGIAARPAASSSPTPTTEAKRETPRTPVDAVARPAPRPAAPRIEPGWSTRIGESSARLPHIEPARPIEPARRPEYQPPDAVRPEGFSSLEPKITADRTTRIERVAPPSRFGVEAENSRESAGLGELEDAATWSSVALIESDASVEVAAANAPESDSEAQPEILPAGAPAQHEEAAGPLDEGTSTPIAPSLMDEATIELAAPADNLRSDDRRIDAETGGPGRGREPSTADGPAHATSSSTPRGARRRKPGRDRPVGGRRGEPSIRTRLTSNDVETPGDRRSSGRPEPEVEWPTVRDILANQQNRSGPRPAVERRRSARQTVPTVPSEPGQWTVPAWLALPPVGVAVMGVGLLACALAWKWAEDASTTAFATGRLLTADGTAPGRPLPDGIGPPRGRWFGTTAQHLAHWGVYVARATREEQVSTAEAPELLKRALEVSPLNPTARLALAQLEAASPSKDGPGRVVGLSRDAVSLAWSARRLAVAGKKDAALRLYGRALAAAAAGPSSRTEPPRFDDDASRDDDATRRYMLPAEDAVRSILLDLAAREGWTFADWAPALPDEPVVLLTAARMLSERGDAGADALLDRILGHAAPARDDVGASPRMLAARAEALVLRSRWREAAETYRRAIDLADNDLVRRSWWFNLAEIARRLNDEPQRQAAIRAAVDVATTDEIARRARLVLQKAGPETVVARPPRSLGPARAN